MNAEGVYVYSLAGILGVLGYLYGGYDALLAALLAIIAISFVSSLVKGLFLKELSSTSMYLVGAQKVGILLIVAVANIIDGVMELGGMLRSVCIAYFIANEGISLLENWGAMGLPIPKRLKEVLFQLKGK